MTIINILKVYDYRKSYIFPVLFFAIFSFSPEICIVILIFVGLGIISHFFWCDYYFNIRILMLFNVIERNNLLLFILLFFVSKNLFLFRLSSIFANVVELVALICLLLGLLFLKTQLAYKLSKIFGISLSLAMFVHMLVVLSGLMNNSLNYNWVFREDFVKVSVIDKLYIVKPISNNVWVNQSLGFQGSGVFVYTVSLRSNKAFSLPLWIQSPSLHNPVFQNLCQVKISWSNCTVKFRLDRREQIQSVLGTVGSLNRDTPSFEIRDSSLKTISPPSPFEILTQSGRVKSWAYNENAFGAWMAVVGILCLIFLKNSWESALSFCISIIAVLTSGSRNALLSFLIASMFFLAVQFRMLTIKKRYKLFFISIFTAIIFIIFSISQLNIKFPINESFRSTNFSYDFSSQGRIELWHLTLKIWLENPQNFIFGSGDLKQALLNEIDSGAILDGLEKDNITHAHNLLIQTLGESGFIGASCLLLLWYLIINRSIKSRDWGALAIFLVVFILNIFDLLFYYAPVQLAFWMAVVGFKQVPDIVNSKKALVVSTS